MAPTRRFGTIRKLPSGRYQARYSHLGKQIGAEVTFATKADARAWLSQIEVEITGGQHHDPTSGQERFGRFAARWLEARDIRPGTRATYQSQLTHILKSSRTSSYARSPRRPCGPGTGTSCNPGSAPTPLPRSTDSSAR